MNREDDFVRLKVKSAGGAGNDDQDRSEEGPARLHPTLVCKSPKSVPHSVFRPIRRHLTLRLADLSDAKDSGIVVARLPSAADTRGKSIADVDSTQAV